MCFETRETVATVERSERYAIQGGSEAPETVPVAPHHTPNRNNNISLSIVSSLSSVSRTPFVRAREDKLK
jgi:hypothetical protein